MSSKYGGIMEQEESIKLAYLAGIMDGDGSFSLCKRNSTPNPLFYPMIQLANQNKELIHSFYDQFGGYINLRKSWVGKDGSQRKDSWRWKLEKRQCLNFLNKIIPFLIVKKQRAEYLLNYIGENVFKRGIKLTSETIIQREKSRLKMISFNVEKNMNRSCSGRRRKTPLIDPVFWSYVSGLMDSDGSFSIKRETKNICKSFKYLPIISLSMTDIEGLNHITKHCPYGNIKLIKSKNTRSGLCYRFSIHSHEESALFIESCLPYLRIKKERAKILYKFCKNKKRTKYCRVGVSAEENSFREECYKELIELNNGVYKSPLIDLEILQQDNKAEDESHRERLNKKTSK